MFGSNKIMDMESNNINIGAWSELVPDILHKIKQYLPLPDLIRFSCVCTSWRSLSATEIRHKNRLPWLIVPYVVDDNSPSGKHHNYCHDGVLGFFSILDGGTYKFEIPELYERRICGTSYGWLITVHANSEMHLLHPFTRESISLPPLTKFPHVCCSGVYGEQDYFYRVRGSLSKNAYAVWHHSPEGMRDIHIRKVITIHEPKTISYPPVAVCITELTDMYFCKRGKDPCWIRIECGYECYSDLAFYKGSLYAVRNSGEVDLVTGLDGSSRPTVSLFATNAYLSGYNRDYYLVASSTELLLIVRFYSCWIFSKERSRELNDHYRVTERFRVFKLVLEGLNLNVPEWLEMSNLGDRALFVGFNESFSVVASEYSGCKANSIYFSDDTKYVTCRGHDKGIFSLDRGTIEKIYSVDSSFSPCSRISPEYTYKMLMKGVVDHTVTC